MMHRRFLSVFFLSLLFVTAASTDGLSRFGDALNALVGAYSRSLILPPQEQGLAAATEGLLDEQNDALLEALPCKPALVELNGAFLKSAGTRSYYSRSDQVNITTQGYSVGQYAATSTDYEVEQLVDFKAYLDAKGIDLLYVNEPAKYIDDAFYREQFGGESYLNRNADLFLERIAAARIEYLDLRDCIREEGLDTLSLFYHTDHHWTVPASLWAAGKVAEKLNDAFGYDIDLSCYDPARFNTDYRPNAWLGEQGRKVSKSYLGLDDFALMTPNYPTDFTLYGWDDSVLNAGGFGVFLNEEGLASTEDYYTAPSLHYCYGTDNARLVENHLQESGRILILGDSYQATMTPFFSLGVAQVTSFIPRNKASFGVESIRDLVEDGSYDAVVIAYAQFMIGAHDTPGSANYEMFDLS